MRSRGRTKSAGRGGKNVLWFVLFLALAGLCFCLADQRYRKNMREKYGQLEQFTQQMLAGEKAWIRRNQGPSGEIYMNHTHEKAAGDVNPYFACQAARGLLAGEPSKEDLTAVARYLRWHTETLLREQGEITHYRLTQEGLISTGEKDSVDSYIAVYLTLMAEYEQKGGTLDEIPGVSDVFSLCARKLKDLTRDSLTQVSPTNGTCYLMDNAEVLEACRAAAQMLENREMPRADYLELAGIIEAGIEKRLWQPGKRVYSIGRNENGTEIPISRWEEVYPDALAQLFPAICGGETSITDRDRFLYQSFCNAMHWETLDLGDTRFPWACISYGAVLHGDYERAWTYLVSFQARYGENREYPFHTAEAGWACRTCAGLLKYYRERLQSGLLDAVMKEIHAWNKKHICEEKRLLFSDNFSTMVPNKRERGEQGWFSPRLTIKSTWRLNPRIFGSGSENLAESCIWNLAGSCMTTTTPPACCPASIRTASCGCSCKLRSRWRW